MKLLLLILCSVGGRVVDAREDASISVADLLLNYNQDLPRERDQFENPPYLTEESSFDSTSDRELTELTQEKKLEDKSARKLTHFSEKHELLTSGNDLKSLLKDKRITSDAEVGEFSEEKKGQENDADKDILSAVIHHGFDHSRNEISERCEDPICEYVEEVECGACHSVYLRDCVIKMEPTYYPVQIRECIKPRSDCDLNGYRRKCTVEYKSECSTKMEYRDMEEDHPVCQVTKEEMCQEPDNCTSVPVMKCQIQKKSVRKMKPRTFCERKPHRYCRKIKCKKEKCFQRVAMQKEMKPRENCAYIERRICPNAGSSTDCRTRNRRVCSRSTDCHLRSEQSQAP